MTDECGGEGEHEHDKSYGMFSSDKRKKFYRSDKSFAFGDVFLLLTRRLIYIFTIR